jgi:hypothetical protein
MRPDAIRTFPAGYHRRRRSRNPFTATRAAWIVVATKFLLGGVGFAIAIVGLAVAWSGADRFIALAIVVVGGFLLMLPFTRRHEDE